MSIAFEFKKGVPQRYADLYTADAVKALTTVSGFEQGRQTLKQARYVRRTAQARHSQRIQFLNPDSEIRGTRIKVRAARAGNFEGSDIPVDLRCQWIHGTEEAQRRIDAYIAALTARGVRITKNLDFEATASAVA
jgi:hypothetical protein